MPPLDTRYQAALLLSVVGDSLGYKNGDWSNCSSGLHIYEQLNELGGVTNLNIKPPEWTVSSYTLLQLHTALNLTCEQYQEVTDNLIIGAAKQCKSSANCWDMKDRNPDETFMAAREKLNPTNYRGSIVPFDPNGISCAVTVRGMCIGMRHPNPAELQDLIKVSIDFGRVSHHHPTGYLSTLATALFTSYAIQKKPVRQWGHGLMETLPKAMLYVQKHGIAVQENLNAWNEFADKWQSYVKLRGIETGENDPIFPDQYDIKLRESFYKSISETDQPGSNGCDAIIIAYDVFLSFDGSWEDLCVRSICHGGLGNVTCSITACWYGAMFGYDGVKDCNYKKVEFWRHFKAVGHHLYNHSYHSLSEYLVASNQQPVDNNCQMETLSEERRQCIYVREGISINKLIESQVAEIRKDVTTDEAIRIGDTIYTHLRHFMDKLGNTHPSWSISELLKVGSFHEGTKIHFVDEFDFIAVLSELSEPDAITVDCNSQDEGKVELCLNEKQSRFLNIGEDWDRNHRQEQQAIQIMEHFCKLFYNTVMSDRKPLKLASFFDHFDCAEPMPLPQVNGIELSIRFSEVRLPNLVLEFFYKARIISVDVTLAVRYRNVNTCFRPENATVPEIGKAVIDRGSLLLVAYMGGFRITLTETEVEYILKRLKNNHKILYLYLKFFNYKYGEHRFLKLSGYLPFSSYMLKTIVIHHDKMCMASTPEHETCLRDVVDIMQKSIGEGYLYPAETLNGTVIGYLPSVFDKFKNLYNEPYKSVKCLKSLRHRMIDDLKATHFSGRTWSSLDAFLKNIHDKVHASAEEVCNTDWWQNRKHGLILKLK